MAALYMRTITDLTVIKRYECLKLGNQLREKIILMKEEASQLMSQLLVSYRPCRLSSAPRLAPPRWTADRSVTGSHVKDSLGPSADRPKFLNMFKTVVPRDRSADCPRKIRWALSDRCEPGNGQSADSPRTGPLDLNRL
jgi:hypothetical protein